MLCNIYFLFFEVFENILEIWSMTFGIFLMLLYEKFNHKDTGVVQGSNMYNIPIFFRRF